MGNSSVKLLLLILLVSVLSGIAIFYFLGDSMFSAFSTGRTVSTGEVKLYVSGTSNVVTIHVPENTTYDYNSYTCSGSGYPKCDDYRYILPLNTTANFVVDSVGGWNYSLYDLKHNTYIEYNTTFVPNTTINSVRWGNKLSVSAQVQDSDWVTRDVIFTVEVSNSSPVLGAINNSIFVCETENLDYRFNASDVDEENLTSSISPKNPFYLDSLGKAGYNVSLYSIISGTLGKANVGRHSESVSVTDPAGLSDSAQTNITVIEINNPPVMENLGAQTIWLTGANSTFNHQMNVTDTEDGTSSDGKMTFNLTWGNNENLFGINRSTGVMNYTADSADSGRTYSLRVCVNDTPLSSVSENFSVCSAKGYSSDTISTCDDFTLTVTDNNRAPEITNYTPSTPVSVSGTATTVFNVTVSDADGTIPDVNWYVDGVLKEHNENVSSDSYSYSFGCGVSGSHSVKAVTTDGLLNDSQLWDVDVANVACSSGGTSGGGGGGALAGACREKWVCDDWGICQNAKRSFDAGALSPEDFYHTKELCAQNKYDERFCGFQLTSCKDINFCNNSVSKVPKPSEMRVCYFTENPSCADGITNCHDGACELLVDCGGPCSPCASCSDGKQNQGEFGVDCGGPCPYPCEEENPLSKKSIILAVLLLFLILISIYILLKLLSIFRYRSFLRGGGRQGKSINFK